MSAFVGRERELGQLRLLLTPRRVVTVAGPGGIGKSRLVREFVAHATPEACRFVHVAGLEDTPAVVRATADALGLPQVALEPIEERVVDALRTARRLLVFDEAERCAEALAPFVVQLMQTCPYLSVLVTSRAPIEVGGERVVQLGPLEGAKELFLNRLLEARPDLHVGPDAATSIDAICRKLDGIPLAIELAAADVAARASQGGPQAAQRLDEHLDAYGVEPRRATSPESTHFRALAIVLDWSHQSLTPMQRRCFARLSAFEGSFTLDAASRIAYERDAGEDVGALLDALVARALVRLSAHAGEARFSLHPVVREFASGRLAGMKEAATCAKRFCDYYCSIARAFVGGDGGGDLVARIEAIATDWDNIRGALRRTLELRADPETGCGAISGLNMYWTETGRLVEGWYWILVALESAPHERLRAEVLYSAAVNAHARGDFVELEKFSRELVRIFERENDPAHLSRALNGLANARHRLGDDAEAEALYQRALVQYRLAGDRPGEAVALMNLGATTADRRLDYERARTYFLESLEIFSSIGISINVGTLLANLAEIASRQGEHERALEYAEKARSVFERLGNEGLAAWQLLNVAQFHVERRDWDGAKEALNRARPALAEQLVSREHAAGYYDTGFILAVELGEIERGAALYGYAQQYRALYQTPRTASEISIVAPRYAKVADVVDAATLERLEAAGASMDDASVHHLIERLGYEPPPYSMEEA